MGKGPRAERFRASVGVSGSDCGLGSCGGWTVGLAVKDGDGFAAARHAVREWTVGWLSGGGF